MVPCIGGLFYNPFGVLIGAGGLFGEDEEAKKEFEQLAQQERQLWGTMLSGVAVKEHMEDTYCHMLRVSAFLMWPAAAALLQWRKSSMHLLIAYATSIRECLHCACTCLHCRKDHPKTWGAQTWPQPEQISSCCVRPACQGCVERCEKEGKLPLASSP